MRIIKEGNIHPKEIRKSCTYCNTLFSYTKEDIIPDSRDGDYIKCPKCSAPLSASGIETDMLLMSKNSDAGDSESITGLNDRQISEALWKLLDNIDTLSDICKPTVNNPKAAMAFYNNAMKYAGERFKYMKSDGHKLFTNEEFSE